MATGGGSAAPAPGGSPLVVEIGPKEIYDQLVQLNAHMQVMVKQGDDHELRIRSLERRQWPIPTVNALVALAALILSVLTLKG